MQVIRHMIRASEASALSSIQFRNPFPSNSPINVKANELAKGIHEAVLEAIGKKERKIGFVTISVQREDQTVLKRAVSKVNKLVHDIGFKGSVKMGQGSSYNNGHFASRPVDIDLRW